VPDGPEWVHEINHECCRLICWRDRDRVRLFTRRGDDRTDQLPRIAEVLASLPVTSVTIDGEAVVCDGKGVTDFDRLRSALARRGSWAPFLYAFDVLELEGRGPAPTPVGGPA
jgi:bifunctional non-homologous end joining protein LigD